MKYTTLCLLFLSTALSAQSILKFDKPFVASEDRWVVFQMGQDSTYLYGFIYIDEQAGLTLDYGGKFTINSQGVFLPIKPDTIHMKVRLIPNQVLVAFLPETKFAELHIEAVPSWLKYYKTDTGSIERLYRWGFLYNSWDQCAKALTFLQRAQKINPDFKGLRLELAYAYNTLGEYDRAVSVLDSIRGPVTDPCYLYKELSYAQLELGRLEQAAVTCKKGISLCTDQKIKSEIAYDLAYKYYQKKDTVNYSYWAKETRRWAVKGDVFTKNLDRLEATPRKP